MPSKSNVGVLGNCSTPDVDGPAMYPRSTKRKCHSSRRMSTVECRLERRP